MPVLDKGKSRCVVGEENASNNFSSSSEDEPATELLCSSQAKDTEMDEAKETEKYWIKKDEERLAVIGDMEKAMAEMKGDLANTVNAFRLASNANSKLQAELGRKTTSLVQVEEDMAEVNHDLNAAEMHNEKLKKDLAHSQRERKHQFDRAEETIALIEADPSRETIAELVQAKADVESRSLSKQREMESEIDTLNSQLKERCDSVARLTENLSRVADSDRWVDVRRELSEVWERADRLPEDLQIAMRECDGWKDQFHALQDSQEEELEKTMREVRWQLNEEAVKSEQALRGCLRQVFERMVRCALCLELQGLLPFDEKHSAICEQVLKLTGEDYQQPLLEYYEEHDVQEEFEDNLEDDDEDYERVDDVYSDIQARNEEHDRQGKDQMQTDGSISNHSNGDVHTPTFSSGSADTTQGSSSTPIPATNKVGSVNTTAAGGNQVQELTQTWETLEPEKQDRSSHEKTVPTPAASAKPESSKHFTFSQPIFTPEWTEATAPMTVASVNSSDNGNSSAFIFSSAPFFGTPTASNDVKSSKVSVSSGTSILSKSKGPPSPSSTSKGSSRNIWGGISFQSVENKPLFQAAPAGKLEGKSKETLTPSTISKPAESEFHASENPEVKQGSGATKAEEDAVSSTKEMNIFPKPEMFNFGGINDPVSFTASSPSFPARFYQPTPTRAFSVEGQNSRSTTVQSRVKADEDGVAEGESSKDGVPEIEALRETSPFLPQSVTPYLHDGLYHPPRNLEEEKPKDDLKPKYESLPNTFPTEIIQKELPEKAKSAPREDSAPKDVPASAPTPSEPSRKERKAAKKAQEKAAQKAENEARSAKSEERRRVEKAMMMR